MIDEIAVGICLGKNEENKFPIDNSVTFRKKNSGFFLESNDRNRLLGFNRDISTRAERIEHSIAAKVPLKMFMETVSDDIATLWSRL